MSRKSRPLPRALLTCAAILSASALAACSTVSSRINEKPAAFAGLPPQAQNELRHSVIHPGDAPDAVYIALGKPTAVERSAHATTWYYNSLLPSSLAARDVRSVSFENDRVVEIWRASPPTAYPWIDPFPRNPDRERSFQ